MKKIQKNKEEKKTKKLNTKTKNLSKAFAITLYLTLIVLVSLISFVGVYKKDKNAMVNIIPEYKLGVDLNGTRNVVIKVDDSTKSVSFDKDGKEIAASDTKATQEEGVTTKEVPVNDTAVLTSDNYKKSLDIVLKRLNTLNVQHVENKFNYEDGTINLEIPENSETDSIAQFCITKGEFKVEDNDTGDVLFTNADVEKASVQQYAGQSSNGTSVYLNIKFNKENIDKIRDMSNTYVKSTDESGKDTTKKVKLTLDGDTIMSTYFGTEITDGTIQLQVGSGADQTKLEDFKRQANNLAVFLNSEPMPVTYKMDVNRFVYTNITANTVKTLVIVFAVILVLLSIYMIIKYKMSGLLSATTTVGFLAILLLLLRATNVVIDLTGLVGIGITTLVEYLFLLQMLKINSQKLNKENKKIEMKKTLCAEYEKVLPLVVISVVFSLMPSEQIFSLGMVMFWGMIELYIYNYLTLKFICKKEG